MALSNLERQRRYIARLKAAAQKDDAIRIYPTFPPKEIVQALLFLANDGRGFAKLDKVLALLPRAIMTAKSDARLFGKAKKKPVINEPSILKWKKRRTNIGDLWTADQYGITEHAKHGGDYFLHFNRDTILAGPIRREAFDLEALKAQAQKHHDGVINEPSADKKAKAKAAYRKRKAKKARAEANDSRDFLRLFAAQSDALERAWMAGEIPEGDYDAWMNHQPVSEATEKLLAAVKPFSAAAYAAYQANP